MANTFTDWIGKVQSAEKQDEKAQKDNLKLIYPVYDTIKLRLLFHKQDGNLFRVVSYHKGEKGWVNAPCIKNSCRICSKIKSLGEYGITVPFTYNKKTRAIGFAQIIDVISDGKSQMEELGLKKFDVVKLMLPYSAYKDLITSIQQTTQGEDAIDMEPHFMEFNKAPMTVISKTIEAGRPKYTSQLFSGPVTKTAKNQDEFDQILDNLPPLSSLLDYAVESEDDLNSNAALLERVSGYIQKLDEKFNRHATGGAPQATNAYVVGSPQDTAPKTAVAAKNTSNKDCFALYNTRSNDPATMGECLTCESDIACQKAAEEMPF